MEVCKRVRSSPLTQEEKEVLKEVVGQYCKVLENKKTDASSSNEKKNAWVQVADDFNSYGKSTRVSTLAILRLGLAYFGSCQSYQLLCIVVLQQTNIELDISSNKPRPKVARHAQ